MTNAFDGATKVIETLVPIIYGPTTADQRDRATCEACTVFIGKADCYVYAIGGGVAHLCETCGTFMLNTGSAVRS